MIVPFSEESQLIWMIFRNQLYNRVKLISVIFYVKAAVLHLQTLEIKLNYIFSSIFVLKACLICYMYSEEQSQFAVTGIYMYNINKIFFLRSKHAWKS